MTGAGVELVLDARAELGEGPSWDPATGRLIWVDITAEVVHRFDPATGGDERFEIGQPVGAAVPTSGGRLALAISDGFALLDPATGAVERIADVEVGLADTMMNDGKCDPAGRLWAGTKDANGSRPLGSLYRLGADRGTMRMLTGLTVSNGLGWSPDRRAMYFIDSPTQRVDVFDFDLDGGEIANRRTLVEIPNAWGLPDGMTVDEDGFLWVAFWGGSAMRRFDPMGGLASTVEFPVSQVTSCAFGGEDLSDLYVTTARDGLTESQLAAQPLAGALFTLTPGVRGQTPHPFVG
ncbi:MAG TPA: SMP-30/gluconolactonase/LRE family protein [Actinomycetota bacterium]|nr:SMP-30/gluconolactonase/LRE family protein [Actinomycetota bacterium]